MIKEYITELLNENNEELVHLEEQMSDLFVELDSSKEMLEVLQKEKDADKNIFSPRTMDSQIGEEIESARQNISRINENIEYIRSFIEAHIKKKNEFEKLLTELEEREETKQEKTEDTEKPEKPEKSVEVPVETEKTNDTSLFDTVTEIYNKIEICLACLNSDKNRCRKELLKVKSILKEFTDKKKNES